MAGKMKISIIIPAYNEEGSIEKNLKSVMENFPDAEVILVDDASTDGTKSAGRKFKQAKYIRNTVNRGKGYSIKRGVLAAKGDIVIFTDADLPFGTSGIKDIILAFEKDPTLDVVIAEKHAYSRSLAYKFARKIVHIFIRVVFLLPFHDTQAGLKGFSRVAAGKIFPKTFVSGFASDVEMLFLAKQAQSKIQTVTLDVSHYPKRLSHFNFREGIFFVRDLIRIRFHSYKDAKISLCEQNSEEV